MSTRRKRSKVNLVEIVKVEKRECSSGERRREVEIQVIGPLGSNNNRLTGSIIQLKVSLYWHQWFLPTLLPP